MQFKDIVGQRVLINRLTEIIDSGRISHAQLLLGQNGYGTLPLALAYAQYLNCEHRQHFGEGSDLRADSCGECPSCKKYQQLAHSDLHFIFPTTTNNKVKKDPCSDEFQEDFRQFVLEKGGYVTLDQWYSYIEVENKQGAIYVRDAKSIIDSLSMKAYESAYKVVIIWMVDLLRTDAANKLLKILEEPSPRTLFLLVGEQQERLLSTIISRTQLLRVGKIDDESLLHYLRNENPQTTGDLVAAAEGNLLNAKQLVEQGENEKRYAQMFVTWMRQLFKLNMANLSAWVDEIAGMGREQQKQFLQYAMGSIRACYLKSCAGVEQRYNLQFGDEKFNTAFPHMITPNNIERLDDIFSEAEHAIGRNAYAKIVFMELSFRISKALKKR
ncbi:MAG: DNA polymerase III subunit delta [Bacteroidales bacterium]|nr:DNA polymerase III subunit delta [Bacteroidales bacterium]